METTGGAAKQRSGCSFASRVMETTGGGDGGRRRRRTRGPYIAAKSVDDHIGVGYSEGHSFSSDCDVKEFDRSGRDKILDDALFGLLRKQAASSLKRKFSDIFQDMLVIVEAKKSKIDGVDSTVFTRFKPKYFSRCSGFATGGTHITINTDDGKDFILSHFQLPDMLSGVYPLSELDVFVCFMTIALSCFICP